MYKERSNHRIETYDIETHEKIFVLPLALSNNVNVEGVKDFLCELVYVDDQCLYLQKFEDKKVFSVNYYRTISNESFDNFFYSDNNQNPIEGGKKSKNYLQSFLYFVKGRLAKFLEHIFNVCFSLDQKEREIILKLILKD